MQKENVEEKDQQEIKDQEVENQTEENAAESEQEEVSEETEPEEELDEVEQLKIEVAEAKDKYLRLYSEFENFRRRTSKEKLEMIGSANKGLVSDLIPVIDDFERAMKALEGNEDKSAQEGLELIYNKFKKILEGKGLKKMEIEKGVDFDDEFHEAITQIPAGDDMAGKVVDVIENGYFLNEKVVRYAKVVTGAKA